jgi:sporulation protein YlmC with PRC-barrel domain
MNKTLLPWLGLAGLLWMSQMGFGAEPAGVTPRRSGSLDTAATTRQTVSPIYRSGTLVGMPVKNPSHETLGEIKELMFNVDDGRIQYAVLSVGGVLGLGDKLFAVPWNQLRMMHDDSGAHFMLNASKDRLQNAPGFDKEHWPDTADAQWAETVNRYYQPSDAEKAK